MTNHPQRQTLSVRISASLRGRLEHLRRLAAERAGRSVSLSAVANRLLESAREDRQEILDLMAHPTESLVQIRAKGEARLQLSRVEWTLLAYYIRQGMEAFRDGLTRPVSRDSVLAVVNAFSAVRSVRHGGASSDAFYLYNLSSSCSTASSLRDGAVSPNDGDPLDRAIADARRLLTTSSDGDGVPYMVGRNLYRILDDERLFGGVQELNNALRPFWPALWLLAARGHYAAMDRPVRKAGIELACSEPAIPPVSNASFSLLFFRMEGNEVGLDVGFPGPCGPSYPVRKYPQLVEFRRMVTELGIPSRLAGIELSRSSCKGRYMWGGVVDREGEHGEVWLHGRDHGFTVRCTWDDWCALRELCQRAWEMPDVHRGLEALAAEYGEL